MKALHDRDIAVLHEVAKSLKPCPFCGAVAWLCEENDGYASISCIHCPAEMRTSVFTQGGLDQGNPLKIGDFEEVIAAWNTRVG